MDYISETCTFDEMTVIFERVEVAATSLRVDDEIKKPLYSTKAECYAYYKQILLPAFPDCIINVMRGTLRFCKAGTLQSTDIQRLRVMIYDAHETIMVFKREAKRMKLSGNRYDRLLFELTEPLAHLRMLQKGILQKLNGIHLLFDWKQLINP